MGIKILSNRRMKYATIAILALVMLQAAYCQRILNLKLKDAADDCVNAVHGMHSDIGELVMDIQKGDVNAAIGVVLGKIVPEVQAIQNGGMECVHRVAVEILGEACTGDVEKFVTDIVSYIHNQNMADLLAAIGDFTQGMQDCKQRTLALSAVDCNAELKAILDAEPTIMEHIKGNNFIALISDFTGLKPHIDNISQNCVKKTDACNTLGQNIQQDLNNILADVSGNKDKGTIEGHANSVADHLYDWRQQCFGN